MTTWTNWARDQSCAPAQTARPRDLEEVSEAVGRATDRSQTVRVAGAGHSFTDAVLTEGLLLSLENMSRILDVDASSGRIRVQAGITLHELNERLAEYDLALENLGDIDVQSAAGATQTGTHGTGARLRNLSASIVGLQMVTGDGSVIDIDGSNEETLRAARVGIGALGVVTELTFQTVPAFTLRGLDESRPIEDVLDSLDELADANDHFEFFTFPHSPLALTRTNNRVDAPPKPRLRAMAWANDVLMKNHALGLICRVGRRWPSRIPALNRLVSRLAGTSVRVDRSYRIFSSPRLIRFTEMEYALPRAHGADAVRRVRSLIEKEKLHVPFPLEVRFVAADDAFLSPSNERDTCYVAVHMFEKMEYESFFRAVEGIMNELDGRPHWGKRHWQTASTLRDRYPHWERFLTVRRELDPDGRFANGYVRRVLDGN